MTTVRLAGIRGRADTITCGCMLALLTVIVLSMTDVVSPGQCWLIMAGIVAATALGVPRTFWLRADEHGLTVVRLLVPRSYAWSEVRGLAMKRGEDPETDARRVTLRLRLTDPPGHHWGPLLGVLAITDDDQPLGTEPRELAELFALFGRRGLPVDWPGFANAVLATHGLPPLPATPARHAPTEPVPTPEEAYADAPSVEDEQRHLLLIERRRRVDTLAPRREREFLLRSAAVADRIALRGGDARTEQVAGALLSAGRLADHDGVTADDDQRGYVRQQYLAWRGAASSAASSRPRGRGRRETQPE